MKYCSRCVTPCNRPNIAIDDDGRCNCATMEEKREIDWDARADAFAALVEHTRAKKARYDCVIPVSGGKDSTWQVVTCLEAGLRPLAITWRPPLRTEIGQANLDNLVSLGVDHIEFRVNPDVERRFMYETLARVGSPAVPMHMAIFAIPLRLAVDFRIPLVVWGENSAFEYGGDEEERRGFELNEAWLRRFGCTFGTDADDWISEALTADDLTPYRWPRDGELHDAGVRAVFLGQYLRWDPEETRAVAERHGFRAASDGPRTGYYDFADIDDHLISIHHYLKWYKFGFTRMFDNLSLEIRHGRLARAEAIDMLRAAGEQRPDADIDRFCDYVGITRPHFFEVIERFRNRDVWTRSEDGRWVIPGFLIDDWTW